LYYRLNVLELYLPPLRERPEDIPELAKAMLSKMAPHLLHSSTPMMTQNFRFFKDYNWPGNIRELENIVERFCTLVQDTEPSIDLFKKLLLDCFQSRSQPLGKITIKAQEKRKRIEVTKEDVMHALSTSDGKKIDAAEILGISRMTLYRIMKRKNIPPYCP